MRIRWTPAAASDLERIKDYAEEHHPQLAQVTVQKLYEGISSLKSMPYRGRPGREEGTRELVFSPLPYIAAYRIREHTVEILHIHHGRQQP